MRVLQVEDDPTTAQSVEMMLAAQGHTCETTSLGEEAVKLAVANAYDVILLDIMLPDIDGYEVLKRLHANEVFTPVLTQTGLLSRDQASDGPSLGVEDYLMKPFTRTELMSQIDKVVAAGVATSPKAPQIEEDGHARDPDDKGLKQRKHKRFKTLKNAKMIYYAPGSVMAQCVMPCIVFNLSAGGAALQPADNYLGPNSFTLQLDHGPPRRSEVCWKYKGKIGIRFVDTPGTS